jgi:hypothetical protein
MDRMISLTDDFAKEVGFTEDKFHGYMWETDEEIILSLVYSLRPRQGHLKAVVDNILAKGLNIMIPCPSSQMEAFMENYGGFEKDWAWNESTKEHIPCYRRKA